MSTKGYKRKKPYKKLRRMTVGPVMTRPELKRAFVLLADAAFNSISSAWREYDILGPVTASAAVNGRIGRTIQVHSYRLRGVLAGGAIGTLAADDYFDTIRLMIYVLEQVKTGAALTPANTAGYSLSTPLNTVYMPQLKKVLYDKIIGMTNIPYGANLCSAATREIDYYHMFKKPLVVKYTGDTANYNQTQLQVSMVSDSTAVPHPGFTSGYIEITYYDF